VDEYIEISIDVFDQLDQRVKVKKTLTVDLLVQEILKEFDDLDRRTPQAYGLFLKGVSKPLDGTKTVDQLDIHAQDELVFRYARSAAREPLSGKTRAYIVEETTHKFFEIQWQPAVIGRPDASDPYHNQLLAVNMEPFKEGKRVLRRHAQITVEGGQYYIESMASNNPTYLNDETDPIAQKRRLQQHTRIRLGRDIAVLTFLLREGQGREPAPDGVKS